MSDFDLRTECDRALTLTADQHRIGYLLTLTRNRISDHLKAQYAATGAVAKFKNRKAGEVRLDGADPEPKAVVTDPAAYASWVAERHPTEAVATIEVPADRLDDALAVLALGGIDDAKAKVEVRDVFKTAHLKGLDLVEVDDTDPTQWTAYDPESAEQVDGVGGRLRAQVLKVLLPKALKEEIEADATAEDTELHPADSEE